MSRSHFKKVISINPANDDLDIEKGSQVSVFIADTGTLATIYDSRTGGLIKPNPIIATDGVAEFYADPGRYDVIAKVGGTTVASFEDVLLMDEGLNDRTQYVAAEFTEVADFDNGGSPITTANGLTIDSSNVGDYVGRTISVTYNNTVSKAGAADYVLWTLSAYRTEIGDGAWVPDGYGDHYFYNNSYVAILQNELGNRNVLQYGVTFGADDTLPIQAAFNSLYGYGGVVFFPQRSGPWSRTEYNVTTINPYSTNITANKYPVTTAGGQLNMVTIKGDGMTSVFIRSIGGDNCIHPFDPSLPATPGRLSITIEDISLVGDETNNTAVKTGRGFYGDTLTLSLSYAYFNRVFISYFGEGFNYLGYEGAGPLSDGHCVFSDCWIMNNTTGSITAVDNVQYNNCYVSRNSHYGVWFREGQNLEVNGGKIQLNGQDNFGSGDVFTKVGQIRVGGTVQRTDGVGTIALNNLYMEPTFESGNTKHSFIDIYPEDGPRTMIVESIKMDNCYVNGKDCTNLVRLDQSNQVDSFILEASSFLKFALTNRTLIELGSSARVQDAKMLNMNSLNVEDSGGSLIPQWQLMLVDASGSNPQLNYNVHNGTGIISTKIITSAIGAGVSITTPLEVGSARAIYRVTVDDVYDSGGSQLISLPYIGLLIVTPDATQNVDIQGTSYSLSVDGSGFLVITNDSGGARIPSYCVEKLVGG